MRNRRSRKGRGRGRRLSKRYTIQRGGGRM